MSEHYESECARINPRVEREIQDREKRIQELLKRATGVSIMKDDKFGISVETSKNYFYQIDNLFFCNKYLGGLK